MIPAGKVSLQMGFGLLPAVENTQSRRWFTGPAEFRTHQHHPVPAQVDRARQAVTDQHTAQPLALPGRVDGHGAQKQRRGPASSPVPADTGVQLFSQIHSSGVRQRACRLTGLLLLALISFGVPAEEDVIKTIFLVTERDRVIAGLESAEDWKQRQQQVRQALIDGVAAADPRSPAEQIQWRDKRLQALIKLRQAQDAGDT